jgi:hypothetical protein
VEWASLPSLIDSQETVDWDGLMVVTAFQIAGYRAARQPHVIYQFEQPCDPVTWHQRLGVAITQP